MYVSYTVTARGSPRQELPSCPRARAAADCNRGVSHCAGIICVSLAGRQPSGSARARAAADCNIVVPV